MKRITCEHAKVDHVTEFHELTPRNGSSVTRPTPIVSRW